MKFSLFLTFIISILLIPNTYTNKIPNKKPIIRHLPCTIDSHVM